MNTCFDSLSPEGHCQLKVKVDSRGRVWVDSRPLNCPLELPADSRGELCFNSDQVVLLLGPWGPDPCRYMILPGVVQLSDENGLLLISLGADQPQLLLPCDGSPSRLYRPGQRVWLALAEEALSFRG